MTYKEALDAAVNAVVNLVRTFCDAFIPDLDEAAAGTPDFAHAMLSAAKKCGTINPIWCDGCGDCTACRKEGSDEAQLACIRRWLNAERP